MLIQQSWSRVYVGVRRYGSGQGDLVWDRMPFDDDEWQLYAETLWEYQYVQQKCPLTEQLSRALHDVSYGILDIANRIYLAAQVRAIEKGMGGQEAEAVTEGLLRSAYRDDFRLVSHILETLKTGDPSLLHGIRDVCPPAILPVKDSTAKASDSGNNQQTVEANESRLNTEPAGGGTLSETPSDALTGGIDRVEHTGRDQLFPDSDRTVITKQNTKRRSRKILPALASFEDKDLRGIVARGQASHPQVDPYPALAAAGYIKDASEFLSPGVEEA